MRHDHDGHGESAQALRELTRDFTPPDHACGSWRRLYAGLAQLAADLEHHMRLENDILFPRFESGA
jgi:regulator of cell morphogenesis and NO signaling